MSLQYYTYIYISQLHISSFKDKAQNDDTKSNECPSLVELIDIPIRKWFTLGLKLGLSDYDLQVIQDDYPRDSRACKRVMFTQWLATDVNASYKTLIYALEEMANFKIAHQLRSKYGNQMLLLACDHIRVSVDSPCRDDEDTPIK